MQSKGRVELGVGYVKKNFLHGLELTDFNTIQAAAQVWLDTIANVRIHGETQQRPVDLFAQERPHLGPLNPHPYDLAHTSTSVASSQFRISRSAPMRRWSAPIVHSEKRRRGPTKQAARAFLRSSLIPRSFGFCLPDVDALFCHRSSTPSLRVLYRWNAQTSPPRTDCSPMSVPANFFVAYSGLTLSALAGAVSSRPLRHPFK